MAATVAPVSLAPTLPKKGPDHCNPKHRQSERQFGQRRIGESRACTGTLDETDEEPERRRQSCDAPHSRRQFHWLL